MSEAPQTVCIGDHRFELRDLTRADEAAFLALHRRVFGSDVQPDWFAWKYHAGQGEAATLWHEGQMIACCGGTPRRLRWGHRLMSGLQIGDVMVHPDWRGLLTRRGPFYQVSQSLYTSRLGARRAHALGFGFPSSRHLHLAEKLGLLADGGAMSSVRWPLTARSAVKTPASLWPWQVTTDAAWTDKAAWMDTAWAHMQDDHARRPSPLLLGERNASHLVWRYGRRPGHRYLGTWVKRLWSSHPKGLIVWRLDGLEAQWLDWIGPTALLPMAAHAVVREATRAGAHALTLWASPLVVASLRHGHALEPAQTQVHEVARIGVPTTSLLDAPATDLPWWWMGGDTDFL